MAWTSNFKIVGGKLYRQKFIAVRGMRESSCKYVWVESVGDEGASHFCCTKKFLADFLPPHKDAESISRVLHTSSIRAGTQH